jgi:hypothetical protein
MPGRKWKYSLLQEEETYTTTNQKKGKNQCQENITIFLESTAHF